MKRVTDKDVDAVGVMREARKQLGNKLEDMKFAEQREYLRRWTLEEPLLARFVRAADEVAPES